MTLWTAVFLTVEVLTAVAIAVGVAATIVMRDRAKRTARRTHQLEQALDMLVAACGQVGMQVTIELPVTGDKLVDMSIEATPLDARHDSAGAILH